MLAFFPTPYKGEVLYSVLARYCVRCAETSPKNALESIFGNKSVTATVDLPSHIDALIHNLPYGCKINAERLIELHTLYPLYRPFLLQNQAETVLLSMKGSQGGDIHTRAGITASSIPYPRYLRFCHQCFSEDRERIGEGFWYRLNQTPGVLVCPKHSVLLSNSMVPVHGLNKHVFEAANEYNCKVQLQGISFRDYELENLVLLAQDVDWLLEANINPFGLGVFKENYLTLLIGKGLATSTGRVYQKEFSRSFIGFHGHTLLQKLNCLVDINSDTHWLASIVRKHRKSFHPIRHLLLMRYLTGSAQEFFSSMPEYKPFGEAPWPCLNAAAEHYLQPVVWDLRVTHCYDTKRPVGTFTCLCSFVFSRRGPDMCPEDRFKIGRIKDFGIIWFRKLEQLVSDKTISYREIARILKVDTNTVIKYSKLLLNGQIADLPAQNIIISCESVVNGQKMQETQEIASKLDERIDKAKDASMPSQKNRVDWEQRDHLILVKVKKVVAEILNTKSKPKRITISGIGKILGLSSLIEKKLDKLPLTKKYLHDVSETVEDFQIRRVKWAANELRQKGEALSPWKIGRLAGIKSSASQPVMCAIRSEIIYESRISSLKDVRSDETDQY